jgi:predicted DNA-binding transcriptional regulator AlpA
MTRPVHAPPAPPLEPLLSIDGVARALSVSRPTIERMRSGGKLPLPDLHIGRMPRWRCETIRRWIEGGGR